MKNLNPLGNLLENWENSEKGFNEITDTTQERVYKTIEISWPKNSTLIYNWRKINEDEFKKLIVDGKWMKYRKIKNGDMVLMSPLTWTETFNQKDILVYDDHTQKEFKVREFISEINVDNKNNVLKRLEEILSKKEIDIIKNMIDNTEMNWSNYHITKKQENKNRIHKNRIYELYPSNMLYGKVEYTIDKNKFW